MIPTFSTALMSVCKLSVGGLRRRRFSRLRVLSARPWLARKAHRQSYEAYARGPGNAIEMNSEVR